jgi:signal transduction histidine kinase
VKPKTLFLVETTVLALVYFCCGEIGLSLAFVHPSATAVWPPTGIALVALLLRGRRLWPGVFAGAFAVNVLIKHDLPTTFAIAAGNTLEALLGAWLVTRFAGGIGAFERTRTIFNFVFVAAMGATTVSASMGTATLCLGGLARWQQFWPIWLTWWLGDMVSNLIIAPLLLVWLRSPEPGWTQRQIWEGIGLLAVVVWIGEIVFMGNTRIGSNNLAVEYLAIPPLLYAAFRFGERGALTSAFVMSGLAVWGTWHGHGPFARPDPNTSLLLLQIFMGTITLTAVVLASIISERRRTQEALHAAREELHQHAKELEVRVRERTAKLQETVQSLESLCYTIAHDLRGPLRAMSGYSDVLVDEYGNVLDASARHYAEQIKSGARRMDQLILDLLRLGRLGSVDMSPANVQLEEIARKVLGPLEQEIRAKGADVQIRTPLLPVWANDLMLEQIIANLLSNALKFSRPETAPRVEMWTEEKQEWVRLCIRDNGIGIPPEHVERIFQPFEKLVLGDGDTGTGIGLAIVRKGVERMAGRVGVESNLGKGSCFWIELPAVRRQD